MKKSIFILVIISIITTIIILAKGNNDKVSNTKIEPLSFNFNINKDSSYQLKYSTTFEKNIYNINSNIDLKAILEIKPLKKEKNKIYVAFKLSNINISFGNQYLEKAIKKIYSQTFVIVIDKDGRFLNYYLSKESIKVGLFNLVSLFEIILKNKTLYTTQEKDAVNGIYYCTYRVNNNDIYKTRQKYISPTNDITINSSYIKAKIDTNGNWLYSLEAIENITTVANNNPIKTKNTLNLKKLKVSKHTLKDNIDIDELIKSIKNQKDDIWQKEIQKSLKKEIKEKHITFEKLISNLDIKNIESLHQLELYLKLNPNEIYKMYDLILESDEKVADKLIMILENLQLPQAQEVLIDIATNYDVSQNLRLKSIISLGSQKNVSEEIIDSLWTIQDSDDEKTISNTALLALGSISSYNKNPQIDDKLKELATTQTNKIALIYAMNNSGADKFKKELLNIVVDDNSNNQLKANAVLLLGNIEDKEIHKTLVGMLDSSSNVVKASVINALSKHPDDETTKYVQTHIKEIQPHVTEEMVKYLIKTIDKHPENKKYLKEVLPLVQNISIKKDIIKTIR